MLRKFIHIDMDAFYVSVEIRDNPSLANKPVAVGGKSSRRGVLSTCNYIARQFGVSSAMPTALAKQKCPELIIVPGRMEVYKATSAVIRAIFDKYTDKVEPLSLDEAYLDVSESSLHGGSATLIAQEILHQIYQATGLTASAGIAPIKFLAKVASEVNKPNGVFTIAPDQVLSFIDTLSLRKIPGVGKVTFQKLTSLGIQTGADVRRMELAFFSQHFGKFGRVLWNRCQGIDNRGVETTRVRKSVGVERTFDVDISDRETLVHILVEKLIPELTRRSASYLGERKMNKLGVKVKFNDFQQTTKEQKFSEIDTDLLIELLQQALQRGEGKAIRLLGVHIGLTDDTQSVAQQQLAFEL